MALETVVFAQDPFIHGGIWNHIGSGFEEDHKTGAETLNFDVTESEVVNEDWPMEGEGLVSPGCSTTGRRKRRRVRTVRSRDDAENQRMTHIAVERNRRKQMNDYLHVLRSMMPPSYVQRGDQASIIGGAINFVKELEQLLQSLKAETKEAGDDVPSFFSDFFIFPQYSTRLGDSPGAVADVEVTLVDSHANVKVLSKTQPNQLLKMVVGLHSLRLSILHLTLTSVNHMVLYSFSVKVEDSCELTSVNEIAAAVYEMVGSIQDVHFKL